MHDHTRVRPRPANQHEYGESDDKPENEPGHESRMQPVFQRLKRYAAAHIHAADRFRNEGRDHLLNLAAIGAFGERHGSLLPSAGEDFTATK